MSHKGQIGFAAAVATAGVAGGIYCAYRYYLACNKVKLPSKWTQIGTLKDLYIYPIKSCAAVTLGQAECTLIGLKHGWLRDRVLMVVDEKDNFLTARAHPQLLTVRPSVKNSILTLEHDNMEPVHINLAEIAALTPAKTAIVWGVSVPVRDCGYEATEWFSRLLDRSANNFRLVYYVDVQSRPRKGAIHTFYKFTKNDVGALTDEISFHLINEASVNDLNTRLSDSDKVTHGNFRPNFVIQGPKSFEEDNWKFIRIGENVFEVLKPCARCVMTTIDPETGIRHAKIMDEMKSYRQYENPEERKLEGNAPRMGIQIALRSGSGQSITLNDPVYVSQ